MAAPLDYFFHTFGPAVRPTMVLGWVFTAICVLVCIIVTVMLGLALFRKRPAEPASAIIQSGHGLRFVYIATAVSVVALLGMAIYALIVFNTVASPVKKPALTITVTGYQWWWEAVYNDDNPALGFTTANEIHIPVGVPVLFKLKSADVLHAFWVPQLAGKTQMIPGLLNQQWLQADAPGIYRGQCTQYCGVQHAHMAFEVVAQNEQDFKAWEVAQRASAPMLQMHGAEIFQRQCAGCHAVRGTVADGHHGPDLTHLLSRRTIGAGMLVNTPDNLADWVAHVQTLKPGARMPNFDFNKADQQALMAYLSSLY